MQQLYERKRQETTLRESMRWEQLQEAQRAEAERMQHVREAGLKGKQNNSSEHYNIISLEYHRTQEGQQLRLKVGCWSCHPPGKELSVLAGVTVQLRAQLAWVVTSPTHRGPRNMSWAAGTQCTCCQVHSSPT
jgi:hypothetical protein